MSEGMPTSITALFSRGDLQVHVECATELINLGERPRCEGVDVYASTPLEQAGSNALIRQVWRAHPRS